MNRIAMLSNDTGTLLPVEISRDKNTNEPVAVYIRVSEGKVVDTKELVEGVVFADYDASDRLELAFRIAGSRQAESELEALCLTCRSQYEIRTIASRLH